MFFSKGRNSLKINFVFKLKCRKIYNKVDKFQKKLKYIYIYIYIYTYCGTFAEQNAYLFMNHSDFKNLYIQGKLV